MLKMIMMMRKWNRFPRMGVLSHAGWAKASWASGSIWMQFGQQSESICDTEIEGSVEGSGEMSAYHSMLLSDGNVQGPLETDSAQTQLVQRAFDSR
jgi:hypothetical protein